MNNNIEKLKNEIWKNIPGYENKYQASNFGRIRSVKRLCKTKGNSNRTINERILKTENSRYSSVSLGLKNKHTVHRLIALTFIPNPQKFSQINHIDGNKLNNEVQNLEWCTQSENQKHAYKIGLQKPFVLKGVKHPKSKNVAIFDLNNNLLMISKCVVEIAKKLNTKPNAIYRVLWGKRNKHKNLIFRYV